MGIFAIIIINYSWDDNHSRDFLQVTISSLIAIGTTCLTLMYSQKAREKELALRYITEKRVDWINETRNLTGDLCEYLWQFVNAQTATDKDKAYAKIGGALANLYMRYNLKDEADKYLLGILDKVFLTLYFRKEITLLYGEAKLSDRLVECIKLLTRHSQIYLKVEWDRVKDETLYAGDEELRDKDIKSKMKELRLGLYERGKTSSKAYNKGLREFYEEGFEGLRIEDVYEALLAEEKSSKSNCKK